MDNICRDCLRSTGDGFPYGDIKCAVDNQYKFEYRKCDTGKFISKNGLIPPGTYILQVFDNGAWQIEDYR